MCHQLALVYRPAKQIAGRITVYIINCMDKYQFDYYSTVFFFSFYNIIGFDTSRKQVGIFRS